MGRPGEFYDQDDEPSGARPSGGRVSGSPDRAGRGSVYDQDSTAAPNPAELPGPGPAATGP